MKEAANPFSRTGPFPRTGLPRGPLAGLMTGLLASLVAGALALPRAGLAASAADAPAAAAAAGEGWILGVAAVPTPQAPGAKVRTPARIEVLAGRAEQGGSTLRAVAAGQAARQVAEGALDAWVGVWPGDDAAPPAGVRAAALGWSASPMAIMRTDTDIRAWSDLSGRTVCLSADGRASGELSARFGAIEQLYPSAADALLALRIGQCDAAVQDEDFLKALLAFPEWKKFSAQLAPYRTLTLTRLTRDGLAAPREAAMRQATSPERLRALARLQARDIAFEVYLDQTVPDCH
ncbi:putative substrate-binding protein [Castellaniella defragrans 65Phen]|uniref:Putative substrate-binding protein n=2 Tax=Castellaniella defragrans TaxID=75697 RepID=W8X9E4_CASD6|nr:putative substrate-binding protein [Castellaniella defragrans 65Phen]